MYSVHAMNIEDEDIDVTLPLLQSIEESSDLTQRSLAKRLGLALGLTNSYLKRCIRKGLVKIEQVPANRYLYYLTPQGFSEKSRLTAKYLSSSFQFYRRASDACLQIFEHCHSRGWNRVVVCGISDLAEIVILHSSQVDIEILGTFDEKLQCSSFLNYPVWHNLSDLPENPVCIVTALDRPQNVREKLKKITDEERIFLPEILKL